ncbi:HlyD family efflux transporter periplasmic adaptor subunit [Pararhodospirillum photometricum]|uniref:HlyD family secretion protein n=1 Tax=Pararhodospirillum photometricum TaxID=1084 RepID=UPI00068901A4|nr:HlyD family efflux transporter periplasmic adaptor subunit [Pararhodospirillum photometricum]
MSQPPSSPGNAPVAPAVAPSPAPRSSVRRRLLLGLALGVLAAGGGVWGWEELIGSHRVETDNAYVAADMADVTPLVAGPVRSVHVVDTQSVREGDVLVTLDDTDARLEVERSEAALALAERTFRQTEAKVQALRAQITARGADITSAQARLTSARAVLRRTAAEAERRQALRAPQTISIEALTAAQTARDEAAAAVAEAEAAIAQAQANRAAAEADLASTLALIEGTTVETAPDVRAARMHRDKARLDLARTVMPAPVDGVVVRRQVEVGQQVQAGQSLMRVVPLQAVYVNANFKEGQLTHVREGQKVVLTSDLYGKDVTFHGRVAGFSAGTGSSMAVIPAQNATGNWIKVVQRLPVRVQLDPQELKAHPLRVGLSMTAEIDTSARE